MRSTSVGVMPAGFFLVADFSLACLQWVLRDLVQDTTLARYATPKLGCLIAALDQSVVRSQAATEVAVVVIGRVLPA